MTTLYKPVKIESAEQAEALPAFTVARYIDGDTRAAIKTIDGIWESIPGFYGEEAHFSEDMIGWTALVPIEAEEEMRAFYDSKRGATIRVPVDDRARERGRVETRYVTPWEAA